MKSKSPTSSLRLSQSEWDPTKYRDTFEENVKTLIKARMEGGEVTSVEKPKKPAAPTDLMAALRQSLAAMEGKKKGPQRVEAAQKQSEVEIRGKKNEVARKKPPRKAA